ncbi:norsolorinic acid reductase [Xylariomycetidae sp. FL0641]|nr:norsolorinic acid reductase [Xylariomycetidae sp. FL0641]
MPLALPMASAPKSPLARYRMLSPTASVRVSPLCLGAMNFGEAWKGFMGACDQKTAESILDFFYEQGGNFIDTANNYQAEESEKWLGEWMKKRGNRDQMVIATKYTTNFRAGHNDEIMINAQGNGTKSMRVSVDRSLEKLQTDYIDLLYVHWWDYSTSIPEVMQSLNQLVLAGKVLYLGISDTPAWLVSKANEYARAHGLRPFCVYQGKWSAACRDFERDIIPMCKVEGMGLAPFGSLGGGAFKTEEQRRAGGGRSVEATETDLKVSAALEAVARRKGSIITSVAQAYVTHKTPYVFPIVGGRTVEHLKGNIEALTLSLDADDIAEIEAAVPFDLGFPNNMLMAGENAAHTFLENPGNVWLLHMGGTTDYVPGPRPIQPRKVGE